MASAYLTTPDRDDINSAAKYISCPAVDHRQRRRSLLLGNQVFTFNEMLCEIIGVPEIVDPEMFGRHDREVEMCDWSHMQILRQWFSCKVML